jgi:lyso-ornithine lipid O-acyltransferase
VAGPAAVASGGVGLARAGLRVLATGATAAVVAVRARRVRRSGAPRRDQAALLADGCRRTLRAHGVEVDALGGLPPGPVLLACNHVSWLDPLVVAGQVPCAPISKLDVRGWPVFGTLAAEVGVIFHARGEAASGLRVLREVEAALAAGVPVLNFPEGTTTDGRGVLRFHKGLFGLAARLGVPVVPVALRYDPADLAWIGDATFVPHYLRLASRAASRVRLRFGEPLEAAGGADAAALAATARQRVVALLEAA